MSRKKNLFQELFSLQEKNRWDIELHMYSINCLEVKQLDNILVKHFYQIKLKLIIEFY
jgi:hypothetical protein